MLRPMLGLIAAVFTIAAAHAQPPRIGNTYDGTHHQPTPSGLGGGPNGSAPLNVPPPAPAPGSNNAVDPLGAKLLQDEKLDPPRAVTPNQPVPR